MISEWRLAAHDVRSPLLIVEDPEAVTDEVATGVFKFLQDGGHVLWSGRGLSPRLQTAFGVKIVAEPREPEPLKTGGVTFAGNLIRLACPAAQSLVEVQTADGTRFPLLTSQATGRGQAFCAAVPLFSRLAHQTVPAELIDKVLDSVLPQSSRRLLTNASAHVEVGLREKDGQQIVHLVNMAQGKRQSVVYNSAVLYPGVASDGQRGIRPERVITDIPPTTACHVSLQLDRRPSSVSLEPQHQPAIDWKYENGRLEIDVPPFAIHQMIVVKSPEN